MGKVKQKYAILYGFNLSDEDDTAYFSVIDGKCSISKDEGDAKRFPLKKRRFQRHFGTPEQWLELINSDK